MAKKSSCSSKASYIHRIFLRRFTTLSLIILLAQTPLAAQSSAVNNMASGRKDMEGQKNRPSPLRGIESSDLEAKTKIEKAYGNLPMSFEVNEGQVDPQVKFISRGAGYTLFLTATETVVNLSRFADKGKRRSNDITSEIFQRPMVNSVVRMKLTGANKRPEVRGLDPLVGKTNYFIGNDPAKWRAGVTNYSRVKYSEIYPGIDVLYYGNQQQIEYDLIVKPGADPKVINISFEGAKRLHIDKAGELVLTTDGGEVRQSKPYVYQTIAGVRREVSCSYKISEENQIGFELGRYDSSKPLIIDPVLLYSTYLGGGNQSGVAGGSICNDITLDADGNAYITGSTAAGNFPTTPGAFQTSYPYSGNLYTVFVSKLNSTGTALLYSTYIAGGIDEYRTVNGREQGLGIAVDAAGSAYITGWTSSINFPVTAGAFQSVYGDNYDVFVTKLSPDGSTLVYSTYLCTPRVNPDLPHGMGLSEQPGDIIVDSAGQAYVVGSTRGAQFPTTPGAYQTTVAPDPNLSAPHKGFITKLNAAGTGLVFSTFLTGDTGSGIASIVLDAAGNIYVTGNTSSINFPVTPGAFRTTSAGGDDAFVTKLNPTASSLIYSTYLGGSSVDGSSEIAIDSSGNAYVTGVTASTNFPTTAGAFQTVFASPSSSILFDGYVTKLNSAGTALIYSTYLGGNADDRARRLVVDAEGYAYVTGWTESTNFPTTSDSIQSSNPDASSVFITKLGLTGKSLVSSTYFGGNGAENASGLAMDSSGNVYIAGGTTSTNLSTSPDAFQATYPGTINTLTNTYNMVGFVSKFCIEKNKDEAPDATATGPNAVTSAEYKFAATLDPTVLDLAYPTEDLVPGSSATGRETEIWTQLYRPTTLPTGPSPLLVFLHGNHDTCGKKNTTPRIDDNSKYSLDGQCPTGYNVVLNHMGYDYLARNLASWGYIVVSINANRGITGRGVEGSRDQSHYNADINLSRYDPNLILARGRLVLRHLQKLSEWNQNGGAPRAIGDLKGKIDFSNVGFMGHSRGGEGVRAAYNLYEPSNSPWRTRILSPLTLKAIYEVAPSDEYADRTLDVGGVAWNVLLPMCDGDLANLIGLRAFDRAMAFTGEVRPRQKSAYAVWGANHNFFNTEWQRNESLGCIDHAPIFPTPVVDSSGSAKQRQIGIASIAAFFRGNVGSLANASFNRNFDTLFNLPPAVTSVTRVERGFTPAPDPSKTTILEDFNLPSPTNYCASGNCGPDVLVTNGTVPNHDPSLRAAYISWTAAGPNSYFEWSWAAVGQ